MPRTRLSDEARRAFCWYATHQYFSAVSACSIQRPRTCLKYTAAARCALCLGAALDEMELRAPALCDVRALCFGAQIFVDPVERQALQLPWATFDPALERLALRQHQGPIDFELESLVSLARRMMSSRRFSSCTASDGGGDAGQQQLLHALVPTTLALHVGALAKGDVREARLLELALRDLASDPAACAAHACASVHLHARSGHALAAGLKRACSFASPPARGGRPGRKARPSQESQSSPELVGSSSTSAGVAAKASVFWPRRLRQIPTDGASARGVAAGGVLRVVRGVAPRAAGPRAEGEAAAVGEGVEGGEDGCGVGGVERGQLHWRG